MFKKFSFPSRISSHQSGEIISVRKNRGVPFSFLNEQTYFNGKLVLKGEARISGQVEGIITSEDLLIIEDGANIKGQIHGNNIEICGCFEGSVTATDTLKISSTANVNAEVTAARLIVEEGAKIKGQINYIEVKNISEKTSEIIASAA